MEAESKTSYPGRRSPVLRRTMKGLLSGSARTLISALIQEPNWGQSKWKIWKSRGRPGPECSFSLIWTCRGRGSYSASQFSLFTLPSSLLFSERSSFRFPSPLKAWNYREVYCSWLKSAWKCPWLERSTFLTAKIWGFRGTKSRRRGEWQPRWRQRR